MKGVFVANKAAALLHFTGNYHCLEDRDHDASLQSAVKKKKKRKKRLGPLREREQTRHRRSIITGPFVLKHRAVEEFLTFKGVRHDWVSVRRPLSETNPV